MVPIGPWISLYVVIHYNWQYEFMRPSIDENVKTYLEVYGDARREEDMEEDVEGGEGSDTEDEDEDGDA